MTIPTDYTFVATYGLSIDGNKGNGILTGTSIGGAAIAGHVLDLAHNDTRWVDYSATGNADNQQTGAFKFVYIPNYSGVPATDQLMICVTEADGSVKNRLQLFHSSISGDMYFEINDSVGSAVPTASLGIWSPVSGQAYEIEINYDLTSGNIYFFIDGVLKSHQTGLTCTRNSAIGLLRIGSGWDMYTSSPANYSMSKLIIFNDVQHTTAYIPGYCLGWAVEPIPTTVNVFGFVKYPNDLPVQSIRVHVTADSKYNYDNLQIFMSDVETTTDSDGYWSLQLIENTSSQVPYTFTFYLNTTILMQYTNIIIPSVTFCVEFSSLI